MLLGCAAGTRNAGTRKMCLEPRAGDTQSQSQVLAFAAASVYVSCSRLHWTQLMGV